MLTCWTSLRMEYALWICRLLSFPSGIFCRSIWWRFKQLKQDFTTLKPLQHSQMWIGYKVLHIHCWKTKQKETKLKEMSWLLIFFIWCCCFCIDRSWESFTFALNACIIKDCLNTKACIKSWLQWSCLQRSYTSPLDSWQYSLYTRQVKLAFT